MTAELNLPTLRTKRPRVPPIPVWVTATGSRNNRIKKARHYLGKAAWVPACSEDREKALLVVVCNLRLYLQLRTDKREKEALEALAEAQGRSLSDLLRDVTHDLVTTFKAGQKTARVRASGPSAVAR